MKIKLWKSAHGTVDAVIYGTQLSYEKDIVKWFEMIDIWGSKGYDRFNDGGVYFEIPATMYDVISDLSFVNRFNVKIEKM